MLADGGLGSAMANEIMQGEERSSAIMNGLEILGNFASNSVGESKGVPMSLAVDWISCR